ncbi:MULTISPECIES: GntR family transcriptional regulator [unclassified Caballeronia]|uniref:GntR family transcriptional regulator n=1 Tax=unclassified Caballeronia TaxID=2646786 RepID=UPI002866FAC3|nr:MULTISPECIES: GntR family transcriptional regulator [unclassified Caballeronia]MDR5773391.1 GntR family transcriptional regulator [Caballeronia sp. LZ002]MDR5848825.1 GntR family transcriptional regulator [Caballeronia sp. LZ003]
MSQPFRTIAQYVLGTLRAEILQGIYPPNTRLRQEEVAKRLNVSTTPVREAFRDLRAEGLVAIDPNKGVVTRELTAADVTEIYELRMVLEPMLAERACANASETSLAAAEAVHQTMCATTSSETWAILNEEFHQHLMGSETGTRLFDLVEGLSLVARPYVSLSMYVKGDIMDSNNHEHAGLLHAYRARDGRAVHEQTRAHLENTRNAIAACVEQSFAQAAA